MQDDAVSQWQERIRSAIATRTPIRIRGGGSKDFYGEAPSGELLDTRSHAGIVDYEPTELVITARAGTSLAEIERTMAASAQMLAFEPPHYGPHSTLGGAVASGLSGPRRPYAGSVRDLVLGVRILDGRGADLAFGGKVMKNVAGFDVARLTAGALGTLGVITEVSLKCVPLPRSEATLAFELSVDGAIRCVNEWGGRPLPVTATCYVDGTLRVRLGGAVPAVESAVARLGGESVDDGASFWRTIRDHEHPFFARVREEGGTLWRLSVKSTAPHADLGGDQLVEWGGALRWLAAGETTDVPKLRAWARNQGGHATLFFGADKSPGVFDALPPPMQAIQRKLKAEFDPHGILNPGRLHPAL